MRIEQKKQFLLYDNHTSLNLRVHILGWTISVFRTVLIHKYKYSNKISHEGINHLLYLDFELNQLKIDEN